MKKEFIESNIVILGKFDPSKYDKLFFIKRELIKEEDFHKKSIFTPNFSRLYTDDFFINIHSSKFVIANKTDFRNTNLNDIAKNIIEDNENSDAIGFNFKWYIFKKEDIKKHTREKFYPIKSEIINNHFNDDDTAFGYYASKNFLKARMKLDIKPGFIIDVENNTEQTVLMFEFNFHFKKENNLLDILSEYNLYLEEVEKVIQGYE